MRRTGFCRRPQFIPGWASPPAAPASSHAAAAPGPSDPRARRNGSASGGLTLEVTPLPLHSVSEVVQVGPIWSGRDHEGHGGAWKTLEATCQTLYNCFLICKMGPPPTSQLSGAPKQASWRRPSRAKPSPGAAAVLRHPTGSSQARGTPPPSRSPDLSGGRAPSFSEWELVTGVAFLPLPLKVLNT